MRENHLREDCGRCSNPDCTKTNDVDPPGSRIFEDELAAALSREQFFLLYQPIVDIRTGSIVALEALLRWIHPDYGIVSPYIFIPIAEKIGLIEPIGVWVLRQACQDASSWRSDIRVSVNFSASHFCNPDFPKFVLSALSDFAIPPHRLELEITERSLLTECEVVDNNLRKISEAGIRLAIDDFGCGYSSLSYLCRLLINTVKIDQTFSRLASKSARTLAVINAISALAKELSVDLIVEGVEVIDQLQVMIDKSINLVQGYFYSTPLPLEAVIPLFSRKGWLNKETGMIEWIEGAMETVSVDRRTEREE